MVVDSNGSILHMSVEEEETFDYYGDTTIADIEVDDELGLELVPEKPSIFAKYGVQCDPTKNSFHKSLYDQYQARGSLSVKQINALRKTY